jgi:bifunctional NMN adenylyltransferase/nudix hydrolase
MSKKLRAIDVIDGEYDATVFIGRMRPLHAIHIEIILTALRCGKIVVVIVGSAYQARTEFNPFTFEEVVAMIRAALPEEFQDRVFIKAQRDRASNDRWIGEVNLSVKEAIATSDIENKDAPRIALIGCDKQDGTGFYLDMFPAFDSISVPDTTGLSATLLRNGLFSASPSTWLNASRDLMPSSTYAFLRDFVETQDYARLAKEVDYYRIYRKPYEEFADKMLAELGYRPEIVLPTVDAIVIKNGEVAVIERRFIPGAGLLAFPGGFVNKGETHLDAVFRELREETRINVPRAVLMGSLVHQQRFDNPRRSSRGRVVTEAFLFHLPPGGEPIRMKNKQSDAKTAKMRPIVEVADLHWFEDHAIMLERMRAVLDMRAI